MKTKEETEKMYKFIGFFNDGRFMNQDYRQGIIDALSFVLYEGEVLERIKSHLSTKNQKEGK